MLQQTQVKLVHGYFLDFLARWPNLEALANAASDDVMRAWAGLGYYSRARNLKKCADAVWFEHGGKFPETAHELRNLPGIGEYTSAAIAAIAFDQPACVVDGNVERVMARVMRIETAMPQGKAQVRDAVQALLPTSRPGDFAQAMMDLGATLCLPRQPNCRQCPLAEHCLAAKAGLQHEYPRKAARKPKPHRKGAAYVLRDGQGRILLQKRPDAGLLGAMAGVPSTNWSVRADGAIGSIHGPVAGNWTRCGTVRHAFTHFDLDLEVWSLCIQSPPQLNGWWAHAADLGTEALPSIMKKVISAALPSAFHPVREGSRA